MGLFDKKKKNVRTPARNTNRSHNETVTSNLGISGMIRELKALNSGISIERSMYRGDEAIVVDVRRLSDLRFPKGYSLRGSVLTNSTSKEGMHEDIKLVTKFDYNFTR